MIKTKIESKPTEIVIDVCCNKCGESCKGSIGNFNGLIEAEISGAFDSTFFDDDIAYRFSLCEKCLKELFESFKIQVDKKDLR